VRCAQNAIRVTAATASGEDQRGAEPHFGFVDQLRLKPLNIRDV
jgi:hypothetical protein